MMPLAKDKSDKASTSRSVFTNDFHTVSSTDCSGGAAVTLNAYDPRKIEMNVCTGHMSMS